jgi:hypothetical protein
LAKVSMATPWCEFCGIETLMRIVVCAAAIEEKPAVSASASVVAPSRNEIMQVSCIVLDAFVERGL